MPDCQRWSAVAINSSILYDAQHRCWLRFQTPIKVLIARDVTEVMPLLEAVEQEVHQFGYYAVGFVSYDAAPAFDRSFVVDACPNFPLAWFAFYTEPEQVSLPNPVGTRATSLEWTSSITQDHYQTIIQQIKTYIAQGLTYQVNFSFRLRSAFCTDPWLYFLQLIQAQESDYGAFINLDDWAICCASPELFFQLNQQTLISRPMKGTAPRGLTYAGDRHEAKALHHSEKNRAENVMIVDMIRNDMGRIAETGSVQVTQLFEIEQYPTLWQMTSSVECLTKAGFAKVFQALFPCASITGAPKSRTMQIITELEESPRRIYTGAIGFLTPNGNAQFNVAIRTVLIDKVQQTAEYGVGGGIIWDSGATSEFEECCTKAKVLTQQQPSFELLESLLWTPEKGYFLLNLHLQRLQESAAYFAFDVNMEEVRDRLQSLISTLTPTPHKVRLRVAKQGAIYLSADPFDPYHLPSLRVGIAKSAIDSSNPFLYHKTTYRAVYEQAKQAYPTVDDVVLWNERGELTETCIANLVIEWDGQWYTPPVQSGLLAGTMRSWLLQQGRLQERILYLKDLYQCSRVFLINSVRQIQEVIIELPVQC